MSRINGIKRGHWWAVFLAAGAATLLILVWGVWRGPAGAYDDAYITYRYADNLRNGWGLLYNPGEWVLGTTTPLFALLLGGLGLLVHDLEWLGHWLGILCWIGAAWAIAALLWQDKRPVAAIIAPLLLALQGALLHSVGMETPLLVLLMLAVAWAWLGGRNKTAVVLAALLLLTRQDSFIWLLFLGLEIWRRERRLPWREGVFTVLLTLPWFLFAFWRYGSPLPNSAFAKVGQTNLMAVPDFPSFWEGLLQEATLSWSLRVIFALLFGLVPVIWQWVSRPERPYWWVAAWLVVYILFYSLIGVVIFPWYFVPALAGLVLFMAVGFGLWLGDQGGWRQSGILSRRVAPVAGLVVLIALLGVQLQDILPAATIEQGYQPAYVPAGQWLADNTALDDEVATIEIGVIGYRSQRPILDTMGLVTADMTTHQLGWRETLVYALSAHRPDYAVTLPNTAWDDVVTAWWFNRDYTPAAAFDNVTLYARHPLPQSTYAVPAQAQLANGISVTGVLFPGRELAAGQPFTADVHIRVEEDQETDYQLTVYLVDTQTLEQYAVNTEEPLSGWFNGRLWQAGDRLALPVRLDVPTGLPAGAYRLGMTFFDREQERGLPWRNDPAGPPADLQLGWLRLGSPPPMNAPDPLLIEIIDTNWENGLVLARAGVFGNPLMPGDTLPVQLTWQAQRPVRQDLTLFVHLVDGQGNIVAQYDSRPYGGRWPVPAWPVGEAVQEVVGLDLPADLPAGSYQIRLGWYDETGRVPLTNGSDAFLLDGMVAVDTAE